MADNHHGHHSHKHAAENFGRAFAIGIALNLAYVAGEAVAGIVAGSLALLADAGHNLGDVLGLSLSWGAAVLSRRQPSGRFTYGLRSSSILAALANAIILLVVTGGIGWEAIWRITHPVPVASGIMIAVAAVGIFVNGGTALLFASGAGDLNVKSAFLHLTADAFVTAGVVAAGIAIWLTGSLWLDPAVSLIVSAVIVIGTWRLLKSAIRLALDAVPEAVDICGGTRASPGTSGGHRAARSPHLGHEHDRDGADLPSDHAARTSRRRRAQRHGGAAAPPFRNSACDDPDRACRYRGRLRADTRTRRVNSLPRRSVGSSFDPTVFAWRKQ